MTAKLSAKEARTWAESRAGWKFRDDSLRKTYQLPGFRDSIVFVNRIATIADELDHHPDILVRYDRVTLTLWSHDAGGVTKRDLALADRIDFATSAR